MEDFCKNCIKIREERDSLLLKNELQEVEIESLRKKYLESQQEIVILKKMINQEIKTEVNEVKVEEISNTNNVQDKSNQDVECFFECSMVVPKVEPPDATEDDSELNSWDQNSYFNDTNVSNERDNVGIKREPREDLNAVKKADLRNKTRILKSAAVEDFPEDSGSSSGMQVCNWLQWNGDMERLKCGEVFASTADLVSHFNKAHLGECKLEGYVCSWWNCQRKGQPFKRKTNFVSHFRIHTGETPFRCPHEGCHRTFKASNAYRYHKQTHSSAVFRCTYPACYRKFFRKNTMLNHYRSRHMFQCVVADCGKVCRDASALEKHKQRHAAKKSYECKYPGCKEAFYWKAALNRHAQQHMPHIVFNCPFDACGQKFNSLNMYRKHSHTHATK